MNLRTSKRIKLKTNKARYHIIQWVTCLGSILFFSSESPGKVFKIESDTLSISWDVTEDGIKLLQGQGADGSVLFRHAPESPCWKALFVSRPKTERPDVTITSLANAKCSASVEEKNGNKTLSLLWQGIELADEPGAVDVSVSLETTPGDDLIYAWIEVKNRSSLCGLWQVVFPLIDTSPIDSNETDRLVVARDWGRAFPQPYHPPKVGFGIGAQWPNGLNYPGPQAMQFAALYSPTHGGLYWGTYDGQGYYKRYYTGIP